MILLDGAVEDVESFHLILATFDPLVQVVNSASAVVNILDTTGKSYLSI